MANLNFDQASKIAAETRASARETLTNPIAVAVLDSGGHLVVMEREDGAAFMRPPIAIGKATKLIQFINNEVKEYEFEIKWGEQTSTDDQEGKIIGRSYNLPNYKEIDLKLRELKGTILQTPPKASAVKINGVRAYKLFRSNKEFEIKKKFVHIYDSRIINSENINLTKIQIRCGKGCYIRSFV